MEMNKNTIVLYPSPGIGHLVSMVELGQLILTHHLDSFSQVIILITSAPNYNTGPYMSRVSAATPSITFHHLPATPPVPPYPGESPEAIAFEFLRLNNPNVRKALRSISSTKSLKITAFIIDIFCTAAFEVSSSLNIPTYYFFSSGASVMSPFLYLPVLHEKITASLKDLDAFLDFPGSPPIFTLDLAKPMQDKNKLAYKYFIRTALEMAKSSGIIVNTFQSLEPRAITAISDGQCIPDAPTPPIYCIGPLINTNNSSSDDHECLTWLNSQPSQSVVFLCFGSLGLFNEEQLKEMARGLENSGHRFLWVVRSPPPDNQDQPFLVPQEPDLNALLPEGFLDRTRGRGLVVKTWAPQIAVLNHDSVGGFVTHCGWNSILEGVCAGVPMIGWPLYAEQRMNKVILVEELKLGLGLEESGEGRFVSGAELEKQVRELMDSHSGEMVRRGVMEMRDVAKAALGKDDGSSRIALASLIAKWKL